MSQPWHLTQRFRNVALLVAVLLIVGFGIDAIFFKNNDFAWHVAMGERFIQGDPFSAGGDWYPLGRAMLNVPPALLPYRLARVAYYFLALVGLAWALRLWNRTADQVQPVDATVAFAATVFVLLIFLPYLYRDLQECGLQLLLLGMLVAAAYALSSGRSLLAGFWLALAATWKTTPILFLPFLVWKRQWRAAAAMTGLVVLLNLMPACYLGWKVTGDCLQRNWERFQSAQANADIAENSVEPPNPRNQSLFAIFARYLQTYPASHPLALDHPAFVQFAELDHRTARQIALVATLCLAACVAWRTWGPSAGHGPPVEQWASVCSFCALLSPMCWRQHLVLVLPAAILLVRALLAGTPVRWWAWGLLGMVAFLVWMPQRELLGQTFCLVLMSYKLDALIVLFLSVGVLFLNLRVDSVGGSSASEPPGLSRWSNAA